MSYCIVNCENRIIAETLEKYGYKCIPVEKSSNVSEPISLHADVLYLKTGEKELLISDCQKNNIKFLRESGYTVNTVKLAPGYKTECKLNVAISDNAVIYNEKTAVIIDEIAADKEKIEVNQGYTKCSTIVLPNDSFITEDEGIYKTLKSAGKNCLLIEKGYVILPGYEYGFIGGASVYLKREKILLFFGDIEKHPDYSRILRFCMNLGVNIEKFFNNNLIDIGGAVVIDM